MDAILIASGPSLTQCDIDRAIKTGAKVFAINNVVVSAPYADFVYCCDGDLIDYYNGFDWYLGEKWTLNPEAARKWGWNQVLFDSTARFLTEGDKIATGGNSGFQALNLAYKMGFRDVGLLGYDMGHKKDEKKHFFGEHDAKINRASNYSDWVEKFNKAAPIIAAAGMKVTNYTRTTALDCFDRGVLDDVCGT